MVRTLRIIVSLILLLIAMCVTGCAEGELFADEVESLAAGGFPVVPVSDGGIAQTDGSDELIDVLLDGVRLTQESINVSEYRITSSDLKAAWNILLNRHPETFYVNNRYKYSMTSKGYVYSVYPEYLYEGEELKNRIDAYNAELNKLVAYANESGTIIGKLLRVNDYLCVNYEYDTELKNYRADSLFAEGTGVCQAYTQAVTAAMNALGIPNAIITSDVMNHTWNAVLIDGSWYHFDATWNDPVPNIPYYVGHDNFLLSDDAMYSNGHYDWSSTVYCTSKAYDDHFWVEETQCMPMVRDIVYYVDKDFVADERVVKFHDLRDCSGGDVYCYRYTAGSYYRTYNPVWVTEDGIYYSVADKLFYVGKSDLTPREVYIAEEGLSIYEIYGVGDTLKLWCSSAPDRQGVVVDYRMEKIPVLELEQSLVQITVGETLQLNASSNVEMQWSSGDSEIVAVSDAGLLTPVNLGVAEVTVRVSDDLSAGCTVVVHAENPVALPEKPEVIAEGAFEGIAAQEIVLDEKVESIASGAFCGCLELRMINLPENLESISPDAFEGCEDVVLLVYDNTCGEAFAAQSGMPYVVLD